MKRNRDKQSEKTISEKGLIALIRRVEDLIQNMANEEYYESFFDLPTDNIEKLSSFLKSGYRSKKPFSSGSICGVAIWCVEHLLKAKGEMKEVILKAIRSESKLKKLCSGDPKAKEFFRHLGKLALFVALDINCSKPLPKPSSNKSSSKTEGKVVYRLDAKGRTIKKSYCGEEESSLWTIDEGKKEGNRFSNNAFYRGQSDYSWDITATCYRKEPLQSKKDFLFNQDCLYQIYDEARGGKSSLIDRYNECFPEFKVDASKKEGINYRFLAWMQHSTSYSPFIDFSTSEEVATSFAIENITKKDYVPKDAAIFTISNIEENHRVQKRKEIGDIIKKMKIHILQDKIVPGETRVVEDVDGKKHDLSFATYSQMMEKFLPNFVIIDDPVNDRMKMQRGAFVFFYRGIIVKGKMFRKTAKKGYFISKHRIPVSSQAALYQQIENKTPQFLPENLMDPYLYFND